MMRKLLIGLATVVTVGVASTASADRYEWREHRGYYRPYYRGYYRPYYRPYYYRPYYRPYYYPYGYEVVPPLPPPVYVPPPGFDLRFTIP